MSKPIKTKLDRALEVAATVHRLQFRKGSKIPYIIHPVSVMLLAAERTTDPDTLCACLLHDVLEDGDTKEYNEQDMLRDFGPRVTDIVKTVTKNAAITDWRARNEAYIKQVRDSGNEAAWLVCAADKVHNLKSILADYEEVGDELWSRFHAGKEEQKWWYRANLRMLHEKLRGSLLVADLAILVLQLDQL